MNAMRALAQQARAASRILARAPTAQKDRALAALAAGLRRRVPSIVKANARDMAAAKRARRPAAFLDRLRLDRARVLAMADTVEAVAKLPDPVGEVTQSWRRPNGLSIEKVRLPLGVVLMIYEARPNVTADAAALCLKAGNAVILRGGSESWHSNQAIGGAVSEALAKANLPSTAVQLVPTTEHAAMLELLQLSGLIDLCIPRGGEGLIRFVAGHAHVPVVQHYKGVCHVYVHAAADLDQAERIVVNAKTSRPGVCNAAECLLVDRAVAGRFLPRVGRALAKNGVELRACHASLRVLRAARVPALAAHKADYGHEFLALIMAIKVVDDLDAALAHIDCYGSEHTEAIITGDLNAARRFCAEVTASAVMVNASTRFNDGGELGLGAEIGISTSRLHAFGPMGLKELTAQKYVVNGDGQVR